MSFTFCSRYFSGNICPGQLNSQGQQWSRNLLLFGLLWFAFLEGSERDSGASQAFGDLSVLPTHFRAPTVWPRMGYLEVDLKLENDVRATFTPLSCGLNRISVSGGVYSSTIELQFLT